MFTIANTATPSSKYILVENLPPNISPKEIQDFFSFCGEILELETIDSKALVYFESTVAASTAIMLNNARFEDKMITVCYYFSDFQQEDIPTSAYSDSREYQANHMLSEWIATGMLLTNNLIKKGKELLTKYNVIETMEPYFERARVTAQQAAISAQQAAKQIDDRYHLKQQVEELGDKLNVQETIDIAKHIASTAHKKAMESSYVKTAKENPYVMKANQVILDSINTATASIHEGKRIFENSKSP